jgi:ATP-binding cassette subfamily B protein
MPPRPGGHYSDGTQVPPQVWEAVQARLEPGEELVASFLSDADEQRFYRKTLLVLTNRRLLARSALPEADSFVSWPLAEIDKLAVRDRGGLGALEALGPTRRLGVWHYTIDHGPAALILADRFEDLKAGRTGPRLPDDEQEIPEPEIQEPPPDTMALFRLWQFARPHTGWMLLAFVLSLAATVASIIPIKLTGTLVDEILSPYESTARTGVAPATDSGTVQPFGNVRWYLLAMLGASVLAWLLGWAQGAILAWVSERIACDLRDKTYAHLQRLSLEYFGGKRTGDLMSRISTDSDRLCQFLADSVVDFAADALLLIGVAAALFWENVPLGVATLLPFPLIVWLMYKSRDSLHVGFQASGRAWAHMTSVLADTIPGIRVVKAFAQEHREIDRFRQANANVLQTNNRVNMIWTFFWPLIGFLNSLGVLVVWSFGAYLIYRQQLSVGVLLEFILLSGRFYGRLESMSRMVNASQRAAASAQRIFEILDRVSSVPEPARPVPLTRLRGELEFRNVGFRYGNRKVIKDLNLKIEAGEMIGLVGHTGAGKSTLINLVCRFFDVAEGAILADGVDIRSYRVADYRRNIGIVLQDPFLFFGSIADNIAYGKPEATREEIIAAAQAARAHEFILQLPDGYDSLVGERGQSLSGGERQRISIARALLIDPRILILDEATSALDSQTERQIQEALQNLVRGRTTIAIAHRLSTLRQARRIVVLERGRIVEIGTHDELLARDGAYAALHRAQQELTKDIGW